MRIIIMRHGDAKFFEADRILSEIGIAEAYKTAKKLVSQYSITKVFTSPKTRAYDTCKIVCEHIKGEYSFEVIRNLTPSGNAQEIIDYVNAVCNDTDTVLLVSHIPLVENLSIELLKHYNIPPFVTASALVVETLGEKAQLLAFFTPNSEIMYT